MTNRREFLQAAAIAGLPAIGAATGNLAAARSSTPTTAHTDLHAIVVDERYAEAQSIAASFAGAGTRVYTIPDGDITHVWLSHIGPTWRERPAAIAGLTARPALFCLEQLALASGLRVVFHAEHVVHAGGATEHAVLRGSDDAFLSARDLKRAGSLWPARVAEAIALHRQLARPLPLARSEAALEPVLPPGAQLLTSWIIAAA
jgi:hypothetical protein